MNLFLSGRNTAYHPCRLNLAVQAGKLYLKINEFFGTFLTFWLIFTLNSPSANFSNSTSAKFLSKYAATFWERGKLEVLDKYQKRIRSNPDTRYIPDNDYVLKTEKGDYYYLCAYYGDKDPKHLGAVLYGAIKCKYNSEKNTYKTTDDITSISNIPEFETFFKLTNNHYHPNEISAELIAMHYSKHNNESCDALDNTRIWLNENVA